MSINDFKKYNHITKIGGGQINELRKKSACYIIKHVETGKMYVGSSSIVSDRMSKNISSLKHNRHKNKPLQEIYNIDPKIEIFIKTTENIEEAQLLEQQTVNSLKNTKLLCNVATTDVTKTNLGVKRSDETIEKISNSNKGKKRSKETCNKLSLSHIGKKPSLEHCKKLSDIRKKLLSTPEGKELHARSIEKISHAVICDGVRYLSKSEAARLSVHQSFCS
jgi:hypothetical protein